MIKREFYLTRDDGVSLYRIYSDRGMKILQNTGAVYDEAIDVKDAPYTYTETNEPVEAQEISDTEALNIILGREADDES